MTSDVKILLTRRWPEQVEVRLAELGQVILNPGDQPLTQDELAQALQRADVVCPTVTDRLGAGVFAGGNIRTKLLANFGVGFNHIDLTAAAAMGIAVTNTPGVLTHATAEIALTLMLMSARRAGEGERHLRAGDWEGWRPTQMLSTQVTGKTLGIVGMGRIGQALAHMAKHGLGMQIRYFSRSQVPADMTHPLEATALALDELLATCDFVSLHCPATPQTHHLINAQRLSLMPKHAHLINTARGDIVDEAALAQVLQEGRIAGAGLDVYEQEPTVHNGLLSAPRVVLLPHMGSGTTETREAMGMRALANIEAYLNNKALPDLVTG